MTTAGKQQCYTHADIFGANISVWVPFRCLPAVGTNNSTNNTIANTSHQHLANLNWFRTRLRNKKLHS
jgi:hypothetical protein